MNHRFDIETAHPYYIRLLGRPAQVAQLVSKVGVSCVMGQGVSNSQLFTPKQEGQYMVQRHTLRGQYSWVNRQTITPAAPDEDRDGFVLPLRVAYSAMLYDAQRLCNASYYAVSGARSNLCHVSEVHAKESGGYTLQELVALDATSRIVPATDLTVSLKLSIPDWVDALNDPTGRGAGPEEPRTSYGLRALVDGAHEASALDGGTMAEFVVEIAKLP